MCRYPELNWDLGDSRTQDSCPTLTSILFLGLIASMSGTRRIQKTNLALQVRGSVYFGLYEIENFIGGRTQIPGLCHLLARSARDAN